MSSFAPEPRVAFSLWETYRVGRRISAKERAYTEAAQSLLKTTKKESIRAQMVRLLLESDKLEKTRAVLHEKWRRQDKSNKQVGKLHSQIQALKEQLQSSEEEITKLTATKEEETSSLEKQIAIQTHETTQLKDQLKQAQTALSSCEQNSKFVLSNIASYVASPEYQASILAAFLKDLKPVQSREAALRLIVLDQNLSPGQRKEIAVEITQSHKQQRDKEPFKTFVDDIKAELKIIKDEDLEPEYRRWYRLRQSDDPLELFKYAVGITPPPTGDKVLNARKMLDLFYGWTDLSYPGLDRSHSERELLFDKLRALKKRSLQEVKDMVEKSIELDRPKEEWQLLVKQDNEKAKFLVGAFENGDSDALQKLTFFRQCSNCKHVSHIDRTHRNRCYHCERPVTWLPILKTEKIDYCVGLFPCSYSGS